MRFCKILIFLCTSLSTISGADTLRLDQTTLELENILLNFVYDKSSSLTHLEVDQLFLADNYIHRDSAITVFDPQNGHYWLKFSLHNSHNFDDHWVLNFANWQRIEAYEISNPEVPVKQTGFFVPYKERDYPFANKSHILASIKASDINTYLVKLVAGTDHTLVPSGLDFDIRHKSYQDKINHRNELIMGIFAGIFIILFFYNLFIYLSTRDLEYLIYIGQILAISYNINANAGYNVSALANFESFPQYRSLIESFSGTIYPALMIVFTMYFLNTKVNLPFWHKVLKFLLYSIALLAIGVVVNYEIMGPIAILFTFVLLVVFLTIGIKSVRKNIPSAGYYLTAYVFSVLGMFTLLFAIAGLIPSNDFTVNYALPTGYALEMLFFSFALANKINTLKRKSDLQHTEIIHHMKEKELMQENIKVDLENKVEERTKEIEIERQKSDELLMNILPEKSIYELKTTGSSKSKVHENVTIMFTDFKGFTHTTSVLTPEKLVSELNDIFYEFDDIVERYSIEKIKTIGDAYFAVAGLFDNRDDHAERTVQTAIEMQEYLAKRNAKTKEQWNLRIGIHTGSVISGVVGKKKFAFDVWGDSVNIASRLETEGEINQINISATTHELIKGKFEVSHRGKIEAKGKGQIDMYFVKF